MRILLWMVLLVLAISALAGAEIDAKREPLLLLDAHRIQDRFYTNPFSLANIGDPFILPHKDRYYAFATGGGDRFFVWESRNLRAFGGQKTALSGVAWASVDFWAPEVFEYQGRFVMIYSARRTSDHSLRVGIAFSNEPEGPYQDLGKPLFDFGYAAIDGTLFVDEDGTPYLFYARDCSENQVLWRHESHIYGVRLNEELTAIEGESVFLTCPDLGWEKHSGNWRWNEGPSVLKHDSQYYLFYSANACSSKEYGVGYAVADDVLGNYRKPKDNRLLSYVEEEGNILVSGPGHNSFFQVGDELFTAYHSHTFPKSPSGNRRLNVSRAGFHVDGTPYINGPTMGRNLLPLSIIGMKNATLSASLSASQGDAECLRDGDEGTSLTDRLWRSSEAGGWIDMRWFQAQIVDCVLIYSPPNQMSTGTLIINESQQITIDFGEKRSLGEPIILHLEALKLESLRVEFSSEVAVAEIRVLGINGTHVNNHRPPYVSNF